MSKKGRKPVLFDWPESDFTAEDVSKIPSRKAFSRINSH